MMEDGVGLHFTASFMAVSLTSDKLTAKGTVATTVCSPADVLKSRIMNASGPGSSSSLQVIAHS